MNRWIKSAVQEDSLTLSRKIEQSNVDKSRWSENHEIEIVEFVSTMTKSLDGSTQLNSERSEQRINKGSQVLKQMIYDRQKRSTRAFTGVSVGFNHDEKIFAFFAKSFAGWCSWLAICQKWDEKQTIDWVRLYIHTWKSIFLLRSSPAGLDINSISAS